MKIPTVFDVCDDLPHMIQTSNMTPWLLKYPGKLIGKLMLNKNIGTARGVTYVTKSLADTYHFPESKSRLIPNGVSTGLFHTLPKQEIKERMGLSEDFIIGFLGALSGWVDLEPAFIALRSLSESNIRAGKTCGFPSEIQQNAMRNNKESSRIRRTY